MKPRMEMFGLISLILGLEKILKSFYFQLVDVYKRQEYNHKKLDLLSDL